MELLKRCDFWKNSGILPQQNTELICDEEGDFTPCLVFRDDCKSRILAEKYKLNPT